MKTKNTKISFQPQSSVQTDVKPFMLIHPADEGGCGCYRLIWPTTALLAKKKVRALVSNKLLPEENLKNFRAEICILQRQYYGFQIESMRMYRKHIPYMIYELDDILDRVPGWSIHAHQMPTNVSAMMKQAFGIVDRVTTTTPVLAEQFHRISKSVDVHVVPNYLPQMWKNLQPYQPKGKIRIGWAGALAHKQDLALLYPIMEHFGDRVEWMFMGLNPEKIPPNVKVMFHPGVVLKDYPDAVNSLNLDIGVIPLEHNILNRCKSGIRVMELGINGCAIVATDLEPYQGFKNIIRVKNDPAKWIEALESYVQDRDLAKKHGALLRQEILSEHMLEDHLDVVLKGWNANTYQPIPDRTTKDVTIVIPVQKNADLTEKCLSSVVKSLPQNKVPTKLVVVQDSAEYDVIKVVEKYKEHLSKVVNHSVIKGFSNSINDGIKESTGDVLILNSDCVVNSDWVDRLYGGMYALPQFASVTPMGTDDSYVSVQLPETTPEQLDEVAKKELAGRLTDIGTPVGFCMMMRREAIQEIGLFDANAYPRIYGEENDWGNTALLYGWKHGYVPGVVVGHLGNVTIPSEENKKLRQMGLVRVMNRYPFYEKLIQTIESLPVRQFKSELEMSVQASNKPSVVMVSHRAGGGVETYLQIVGSKIIEEGWDTYAIRPTPQNPQLFTFTKGGKDLKYPEILSSTDGSGLANFIKILKKIDCRLIVVNTLVTYPYWMDKFLMAAHKETSIPYDVIIHDQFYWCPQLMMGLKNVQPNMLGKFCNSQSLNQCAGCVRNGSMFGFVDVEEWRTKYGKFLDGARQIHTTSSIFMNFALKYLPISENWDYSKFRIHDHPEKSFTFNQLQGPNVAILGHNILPEKGAVILAKLAGLMPETRFVVFGNLPTPVQLPNVVHKGRYNNIDELKPKLEAERCSAALLLSTVPEVHMYTLSDALRCGLWPLVFDLGMQGERVKNLRIGTVFSTEYMYDENKFSELSDLIRIKIKAINEIPLIDEKVNAVKYNIVSDYFNVK